MAEEREVVARLKIEKEGETGAFKETADEVSDLGEAASAAKPKVESFGSSAVGSSEQVAGMAAAVAKVMTAMAAVGAILETAAIGAKVLGEAFGGLDEETDATVDSVAALGKSLSSLDVMGTAANLGRTLANVYNDLTDATKSNVQVNAQLIAQNAAQTSHLTQVMATMRQLEEAEKQRVASLNLTAEALARMAAAEQAAGGISKATADLIKANVQAYGSIPAPLAAAAASLGVLSTAEQKWREGLGLSGKALDESSTKLATYVATFVAQNKQLTATDLSKIFGPMIQGVLDAYKRLGQEAPTEIKKLADGWGILTTAGQKAATDAKANVAQIVSAITGMTAGVQRPLEELSTNLSEALSKIDFSTLNPEQLDNAREIFQQFIDTSRQAGVQIPKDIADQAAALGLLVPAMEVVGTANEGLRGTEAELNDVVLGTSQTFNAQGQELSRLTTITNAAGAASQAAGSQIKEGGTAAGEGTEPIRNVTAEVQKLVEGMRAAGGASKTAGTDVKEGATKAGEGADALKAAGKAAEEAGTGLEKTKTGAEGLGTAGAAAKTAAEGLKAPLDEMATKATAAGTAMGTINEVNFAAALAGINSINTGLDAMVTKAAAAKAALDAVDGDG